MIEDWELGYHEGLVVKYIARAGRKVPRGITREAARLRDLEKAQVYLGRKIRQLRRARQRRRRKR